MASNEDLEKLKSAYDSAWAEAQKFGAEAMRAYLMLGWFSDPETKKTFEKMAERALLAQENWNRAAQLAAKAIADYYSQFLIK